MCVRACVCARARVCVGGSAHQKAFSATVTRYPWVGAACLPCVPAHQAEDSERGGIKAAQMLAMFSRLELQMDAMSTQLAHVERKLELQSTADT